MFVGDFNLFLKSVDIHVVECVWEDFLHVVLIFDYSDDMWKK